MKKSKILALIILVLGMTFLLASFSLAVKRDSDKSTTDEIAAGETTPDETTPDETTADETTPDETTADETTPDKTTADETTPDETTSDESTPTEPNTTVPDTDLDEPCTHVLSTEWIFENDKHFKKCVLNGCSYTEIGIPCSGGEATCFQKAVCQVCGSPYGNIAEHDWNTEWDYSSEIGHAHKCSFECDKHSEIQPHVPGSAATENSPQICVDCGYVIAPVINHVHSVKLVHAKDSTCKDQGNIEHFVCTGCSRIFWDSMATQEITDVASVITAPLGHNFNGAYCSDPTYHWKECSACSERIDRGTHTPGPVATEQSAQICTQCGYVISPKLEHTHKYGSDAKYDTEKHWYECACGHISNKQAHTDNNKDSECDTCSYRIPLISSEGDKLEDILGPAQITLLKPVASGVLTKSNSSAIIDYSNFKDGYVMVKFTVDTSIRLKAQVQGPTTTYTYNILPQEWTVFPLSDGNGDYAVKIFKNVVDNRYSTVLSLQFKATLSDEFAPFLRPNQYVNYENALNTMNKAAELVTGKTDTLDKVQAIYDFITKNISYDYEKAETVQSGYLPDLDLVLAKKKGICFDYAALMAGMLRSQNIACKLVVGYADTAYHAWISVWTPDKGWIDGAIFFDGVKWQLMDPTYASALGSSIINKVNYTSKYIY